MNNNYLFHGKRLDNGEWVEGCYAKTTTGQAYILPESSYISFECQTIAIGGFVEVDPSTVGQYTSLTDKNGVKIFEGAIVKTNKYGKDDGQGHNFAGPDTFEVVFEDGGYCLRNQWRRFNLRPDAGVEVIGSVHDNPELMGDEAE